MDFDHHKFCNNPNYYLNYIVLYIDCLLIDNFDYILYKLDYIYLLHMKRNLLHNNNNYLILLLVKNNQNYILYIYFFLLNHKNCNLLNIQFHNKIHIYYYCLIYTLLYILCMFHCLNMFHILLDNIHNILFHLLFLNSNFLYILHKHICYFHIHNLNRWNNHNFEYIFHSQENYYNHKFYM